ncbi:MAG TPA: hypothetical protein VGU66_10395 [Candidatus Elarobacter sp.]|nr:hypothetical protein [Candidatus Elarobacter sp.]
MISEASATLGDIFAAPSAAAQRIDTRPTWILALVVLAALFMLGSILQSEEVHHVQGVQLQASLQRSSEGMSAQQQDAAVAEVMQRPPLADWGSLVLAFMFVLAALGLATGTAALICVFGGGGASGRRLWAFVVNASVPALGLYLVTTGILARARGPGAYSSYDDLLSAVPSALSLLVFTNGAFARACLTAINPFTLWMAYLYYVMFREIGRTGPNPALAGSILLTAGGVLLQGGIAAISG